MKVFKMNDWDWVCAESEEQAKKFYVWFTDCLEGDLEVKEVSLQDKMYVSVSSLPVEEQKQPQELGHFFGELSAHKTFEWVIAHEKITSPCIIASTEF